MSEVEKSVAEQLKELLDAAVAEKANTADLEGLASEEALEAKADKADLEGVVKAEQLDEVKGATAELVAEAVEAAKAEVREEMEAKMVQAPAILTEKKAGYGFGEFMKHVAEDGTESNRSILEIKATPSFDGGLATQDTPGGRVQSDLTWYELNLGNPFREHVTVMNVQGGVLQLPEVGGISFSSENASGNGLANSTPANNARFDGTDGAYVSRGNGGSLGFSRIVVENFVSQNAFSKPALEDVPQVRETITRLILQAYAKAQADDCFAIIEANSFAGTESVTDAITADKSANGVFTHLTNLIEQVEPQYRVGGMFMVSSEIMSLLNQASDTSGGGLMYDPQANVMRLHGYPVMLNGYFESVNVSDSGTHTGAVFGNMSRSIVLAERRTLSIDEYPQAAPGYNTYFADGRFKHGTWDTNALAKLSRTIA